MFPIKWCPMCNRKQKIFFRHVCNINSHASIELASNVAKVIENFDKECFHLAHNVQNTHNIITGQPKSQTINGSLIRYREMSSWLEIISLIAPWLEHYQHLETVHEPGGTFNFWDAHEAINVRQCIIQFPSFWKQYCETVQSIKPLSE